MKSGLGQIASRAKAPLSAALICWLLFVQVLAGSPHLHLEFHDDAASPDHTCAVKTISQGQFDLADPGTTLQLPPVIYAGARSESSPVPATLFSSVASARGPPFPA